MQSEFISLATGAAVGAVFGIIGTTVPAPPNLAGLLGVVGITLGYTIVANLRG